MLEWDGVPIVAGRSVRCRLIRYSPIVIVVSVRVKSNLLFCMSAYNSLHGSRIGKLTLRSPRISIRMRVKVSALGIEMSDGDDRSETDI